MKIVAKHVPALLLAIAAPLAFAGPAGPGPGMHGGMGACAKESDAPAIATQRDRMDQCLRQYQSAATPAEREKAMQEHWKAMESGMHAMRVRRHSMACNDEMMGAMMDHMQHHRSGATPPTPPAR